MIGAVGEPVLSVPTPDVPGLEPGVECYRVGHLSVIRGREPSNGRWHMSVAHRERLPSWDEMKYVREKLLPPDVFLVLCWPPKDYWLNVHQYCLHLWETRDRWLVEHMVANGTPAAERSRIITL